MRVTGSRGFGAAVLASLLVLSACGEEPGQANAVLPPPPSVLVAKPLVQEIVDWDSYTGRFEAIDEVEVRSRVSGYLDSIDFNDGQIVQKGDLLFVIDQRPFLIAVERAAANVKEAEATLALARTELARARQLLNRGNISQSTYDTRIQERAAAEAAIAVAKAELDSANLDLTYTQIETPISGRISRRLVSEGNLVQSDQTLLTTILSTSPIYFYFETNEAALLRYTRLDVEGSRPSSRDAANPVQVQLSDEEGYPHSGKMDFVENRVDSASGTITGRAVFDNPDGLFTPGLFGRLRLLGSAPYRAVLVPDAAIGTDQSYKFVYVMGEGNVPAYRRVVLGERRGDLRVILEGLSGDEQIIIEGLLRVRPGSPVTPKEGTIEPESQDQ